MTLTDLLLLRYALAPIALCGCVVAFFGLRIAREDLRLLDTGQINGGKRFTTITRITQAGFLLAACCVMLLVGALLAVMVNSTLMLAVTVLGLNLVAVLVLAKEWSVRQTRHKLDEYYDAQRKALHGHRRATDPPDLNQQHMREGNGN